MGDDRVERRAILGAGAGLLASLAGCSGLFIEPEATGTPDGGPGTSPTGTPTETATPAPTVGGPGTTARTPTATATPIPSEAIEIRNRRLSLTRSQLEKFAIVTYRFDVENTSDRAIRDIEFRVRVRYEHEEHSRIVATDYPRFWFDQDDDGDDDGLETDEKRGVTDEVRFERDGRAEDSTDAERFALELAVRRIRYL